MSDFLLVPMTISRPNVLNSPSLLLNKEESEKHYPLTRGFLLPIHIITGRIRATVMLYLNCIAQDLVGSLDGEDSRGGYEVFEAIPDCSSLDQEWKAAIRH